MKRQLQQQVERGVCFKHLISINGLFKYRLSILSLAGWPAAPQKPLRRLTSSCRRWRSGIHGLLFSLSLPLAAHAYVEGGAYPLGAAKQYSIDLAQFDLVNIPGSMVEKSWELGQVYTTREYCSSPITGPRYYYATSSMLPSVTAANMGQYYRLNDYIDVKVEVWVAGYKAIYVNTLNMMNESNEFDETCTPPYTDFVETQSGAKGRLTFTVTKQMTSGIDLTGVELVKIFGRRGGLSSAFPTDPITTISIRSGVIIIPDKCTINEGAPIVVEFNEIANTSAKLNGENYQQKVPIRVRCEGGSFENGSININFAIRPAASGLASFNADYLGTQGSVDRSNLGIILRDESNQVVVPNKYYPISNFTKNSGTWNLIAAPIAAPGSTIPEGEFDASATIVAEFQ